MAVKRRRKFDERKVNRWPSKTPGSKGGQFAPKTGGGMPDWADRLAVRMPEPAYERGKWAPEQTHARIGYEQEVARIGRDQGLTEPEIRQALQEIRDAVPEPDQTWKNGPHRIQDYVGLTDESMGAFADMYDDLIADFPPQPGSGGMIVSIVPSMGMPSYNPNDPETWSIGGETIGGTPTMFINIESMKARPQLGDRFWMPSGGHVPPLAYIVAHEWGHVIDPDIKMGEEDNHPDRVAFFEANKRDLSLYGMNSPAEAYAEVFAEWFLSGGNTKQPVVLRYAKKYGWKKPTNLP